MVSWTAKKKRRPTIVWYWKYRSMLPFTKIAVSYLLYDRFIPKFYRNDGNVVGNKNVISPDLENVAQYHHLQKTHISAIIQPILTKLTKMML